MCQKPDVEGLALVADILKILYATEVCFSRFTHTHTRDNTILGQEGFAPPEEVEAAAEAQADDEY